MCPLPEAVAMKTLKKMSIRKMSKLGLTGDWYVYGRHRVRVDKSKTRDGRPLVQISIERFDGKPIDPPWREKQALKDQIVGEDCEGVEIYPAKLAVQDDRNQYHLWIIADSGFRFTDWIGWKGPRGPIEYEEEEDVVN
jgi:hypothetical protein